MARYAARCASRTSQKENLTSFSFEDLVDGRWRLDLLRSEVGGQIMDLWLLQRSCNAFHQWIGALAALKVCQLQHDIVRQLSCKVGVKIRVGGVAVKAMASS